MNVPKKENSRLKKLCRALGGMNRGRRRSAPITNIERWFVRMENNSFEPETKAEYTKGITMLCEQCNDISLLDLIFRLLIKSC